MATARRRAGPRRGAPRVIVDPPRLVARDALRLVDTDDAYLNLALARLLDERRLSGRDAAFAIELANGTARLQGRYDAILDTCVDAGATSLEPDVLVALRLGCHQLLGMRVAAHAAVGTSVELVRQAVGERPVRMVNAVLRRVSARPPKSWLDDLAEAAHGDELQRLSVVHSHPRWIVDAFLAALGDLGQLERLLEADNEPPAVTLVTRPGLSDVSELASAGARPGRWSPYAAVLGGGDPGALPQIRAGTAGVQDEGSQLAALALRRAAIVGSDAHWLDVCAGPGGKATLLTGLANESGARLVAVDRQPHRARLVRSALRGYPGTSPVVVADGTRQAWRDAAFDRVLVDAPCSGLGALRRRPEARWRRTPADVSGLVPLQRDLLGAAIDSVRVGGVVAYVTCSPHVEETRGVVDAVLNARGHVREEDVRALLPDVTPAGGGPHVQLWPHLHGTDAMFIAVLRRAEH